LEIKVTLEELVMERMRLQARRSFIDDQLCALEERKEKLSDRL
jgi:hypothetical protein